ncbi:MAG: ribosomal-protein-alanine N-acetyltransferase [Crocinitomicaceae bacterium]|jgi:ribosomal-protein-alanine N-acetyltransferase
MELKEGTVQLRHFRLEDKERLIELGNNSNISDNLTDGFPHPYTDEAAIKFINETLQDDPIGHFAIEESGIYVGNIGLHPSKDIYRFNAEIGYFIGEPYWNRGIATKAIKIITRYGFEKMNLNRIYAGVFDYNPSSARVLEKCGFEYEGLFKKALFKNGEFHDELRYAFVNSI